MRHADLDEARELSEQFERAVRAMRALGEHSGSIKISIGEDALGIGASASFEVTAADGTYMQVLAVLRQTVRRQVGDLADALKALGVDVNA